MELKRLKERWINTIEKNEERQIRMWDSRAEEFDKKPVPDKDDNPFLKYMWEKAEPQDFMSALDIGLRCRTVFSGTGAIYQLNNGH